MQRSAGSYFTNDRSVLGLFFDKVSYFSGDVKGERPGRNVTKSGHFSVLLVICVGGEVSGVGESQDGGGPGVAPHAGDTADDLTLPRLL